jgi:hypothetical protein
MPLVIANNPDLTHLDVRGTDWNLSEQIPSLHEILGEISESSGPPLQLQHLGLLLCATRLDLATMRHLKSLTSLKLHHHRERNGPDSCNVHQIWDSLLAEGIRLTALNTDCMGSELLHYLASYSGLQILKLYSLTIADDLANEFFHDILPHHANTLETLRLDPKYEGPWCLESRNVDSILQCHKLVKLAFAMEFDGKYDEHGEKSVVNSPCISLHTYPSQARFSCLMKLHICLIY